MHFDGSNAYYFAGKILFNRGDKTSEFVWCDLLELAWVMLFVQIYVKVFVTHKRESDVDPGQWFAVVKLSGKQYKVVEVCNVVGRILMRYTGYFWYFQSV